MTLELSYLVWGVILLLVHIGLQASFSDLSKGLRWGLSARDTDRDGSVIAGRIDRALKNYLETFVAFAALALTLQATELGNELSATGAALWFWARVIYVPAYVSAIPFVRSIAWFASIGGLILMLVPLV